VTESAVPDSGAEPWVVAGLGNPGPAYAGHRHNVGYLVADELVRRLGSSFRSHKASRAEVAEGRLGQPGRPGPRIVVIRPRCYMNEVGGPVKALLSFFKVDPGRLVAVHDELDIPFDTMRVKFGGGDNGHNGLRSIRASLGTGDFFRVRVGIGRPPGRQDAADFVLKDFSAAERASLPSLIADAADAVEAIAVDGLTAAQQRFHSPSVDPDSPVV
jgi:PTH1 family peptidyl-tRNA hydrolase